MENGTHDDESYSFHQTKRKCASGHSALRQPVCSSSSSSPVARNTVGQSVRKHSTAAALAQNAAPETQENRWDTHSTAPTIYRKHPPWLKKKKKKVRDRYRKSPCADIGCSALFLPRPFMHNFFFKCFFFFFPPTIWFWKTKPRSSDWSPSAKHTPTWRHFVFTCSHSDRKVCVCRRDSKKMEK